MPGEEEARVGYSAQLATTALTTTTTNTSTTTTTTTTATTTSCGAVAASSSPSSSSTATVGPKVTLPVLALRGSHPSSSSPATTGLGSGLVTASGTISSTTAATTTAPKLPPPASSHYPSATTTVNRNIPLATTTAATNISNSAGLISNLNSSSIPGGGTTGGGNTLNNNSSSGNNVLLNNNKQRQKQSFHNQNPLPPPQGARLDSPLVDLSTSHNNNNSSNSEAAAAAAGLVTNYKNTNNSKQQFGLQQPLAPVAPSAAAVSSQLSLKPVIIASSTTPNGNSSSPSLAETGRRVDTGTTCNGHHHHGGGLLSSTGGHHPHGGSSGGGGPIEDEIDEAGDTSKLELQLQFAGLDNDTLDVDVEDEDENNFIEGGIEGRPMCAVLPTSRSNGSGGGGIIGGGRTGTEKTGHPSFPSSGDVPSGGGGTVVVASSAAAAGSAAPTSTTSSTLGGGGGETGGPTNSVGSGSHVVGTAGGGTGAGLPLGDEGEDEEEDVEGGKTVECTEVVVPDQTFAEKCLFYTTAFFILLAVFSLFAFLFLVPFVIDPAFTTIFMEFDPEPALCQTVSFQQKEGMSNCSWTSCREGCTREIFQCKQIRVNYRSARKSHLDDFQRRPNSNNLNNNNNNYNHHTSSHNNVNIKNFRSKTFTGRSSSSSLASSDKLLYLRASEHTGSSFNTHLHNYDINSPINSNSLSGGGSSAFHSGASSSSDPGTSATSKLSKPSSHLHKTGNALHHASSSKHAAHASGGWGLGVAELLSSSPASHNSALSGGRSGSGGLMVMNLKQSKHSRGQLKSATTPPPTPSSGEEPFWDYTDAHLFPNVKGCGYPPKVVCMDFVEKYGKEGTNFSCYYSKVDRALVVTNYDMSHVIMDLVYSMAIPIPSFIISVVYLIFAYFRIYSTDSPSAARETGPGGRGERLNSSSSATTNLQNPGSANRGGGGSSADDPDAETSISVDDKTCIIQRSTSGGLNALSDKLPNSGKGLHAQVIEMNDLNPQLRHPVDGDVFLPQRKNNNCNPPPPTNHERNGPTNPAAKNKGEETPLAPSEAAAVETN